MNTDMRDEFDLDVDEIIEGTKKKTGGTTFPKVVWHSIPKGTSVTTWRIYPCMPIKNFFVKVSKHFHIPGLGKNPGQDGVIQCPRSFLNAEGDRYACAICDKYWFLKKGDESDQKIAELLKPQDQYYVNAESLDNPSLGMGVLALPYTVYAQLMAFLSVPHTKDFYHPVRGRDVTITTKEVGGFMPGTSNKKREYSVIIGDRREVSDPRGSTSKVYDLSKIFAIPTYEFTQLALSRLISSDATAGAEFLPEGKQKWISLNTPKSENVYEGKDDESFTPSNYEYESQKAVELPTSSDTPTTIVGSDGKRICYGLGFDLSSQTCASCPELGGCAGEKMRKATTTNTPVLAEKENLTKVSPLNAPVIDKKEVEDLPPSDDMEEEMLRILGKKSF